MHTTNRFLALVAITLFLTTFFPFPTNAKNKPQRKSLITTTESPEFNPTDTQHVIEHFARMRDSDFATWLRSTLSSTTAHQLDANRFARATWLAQLNIVQDQVTCDRLQQQVAPVIRLFRREHTLQFFIYLDTYPNMQTIAGAYLGVSTGLLQLLKRDTPDNAQLNALVAHELARDIQKEGFITAWKNEDLQTLKGYELFYDAVATATMNHLRMPSQHYALILERMIAYTRGHATDRTRHPDFEKRQSVIRAVGIAPLPQLTISELY